MFIPEKYSKYGKVQTNNNFATLKKYEEIAYWKGSNCESVIDLGSGDGSFTSNKLVQFLPDSCKKIIGIDKYNDMTEYANEHYKTDRISFEVLDAGSTLPEKYLESFNHVFSFYTIQLIRDQRKAFTNIYKLLTFGGSCFITMVAKTKIYETYIALQKEPKWKNWLSNVDSFISTYADCLDPAKVVGNIMTEVGFSDVRVEVDEIITEYDDINEFRDFVTSINITKVPEDLFEDFLNDFIEVARGNGLIDENLRMKWKIIVAFAIKKDAKF